MIEKLTIDIETKSSDYQVPVFFDVECEDNRYTDEFGIADPGSGYFIESFTIKGKRKNYPLIEKEIQSLIDFNHDYLLEEMGYPV